MHLRKNLWGKGECRLTDFPPMHCTIQQAWANPGNTSQPTYKYNTFKIKCKTLFLQSQSENYWVPNKPPTITAKLCLLYYLNILGIPKIIKTLTYY